MPRKSVKAADNGLISPKLFSQASESTFLSDLNNNAEHGDNLHQKLDGRFAKVRMRIGNRFDNDELVFDAFKGFTNDLKIIMHTESALNTVSIRLVG
ncbi:hypothetical protein K523DRAFT_355153 [Schizophyllum commune Tattone D]|nr:hypothetical protein K523DRAFT_355153 [Schizophyllum commune Tattone D]